MKSADENEKEVKKGRMLPYSHIAAFITVGPLVFLLGYLFRNCLNIEKLADFKLSVNGEIVTLFSMAFFLLIYKYEYKEYEKATSKDMLVATFLCIVSTYCLFSSGKILMCILGFYFPFVTSWFLSGFVANLFVGTCTFMFYFFMNKTWETIDWRALSKRIFGTALFMFLASNILTVFPTIIVFALIYWTNYKYTKFESLADAIDYFKKKRERVGLYVTDIGTSLLLLISALMVVNILLFGLIPIVELLGMLLIIPSPEKLSIFNCFFLFSFSMAAITYLQTHLRYTLKKLDKVTRKRFGWITPSTVVAFSVILLVSLESSYIIFGFVSIWLTLFSIVTSVMYFNIKTAISEYWEKGNNRVERALNKMWVGASATVTITGGYQVMKQSTDILFSIYKLEPFSQIPSLVENLSSYWKITENIERNLEEKDKGFFSWISQIFTNNNVIRNIS